MQPTDPELGFELWLEAVDLWLMALAGLTSRDIGDWSYRDAYEAGVHPNDAAQDALDHEMRT